MQPQFASAELNQLLQLELAHGSYQNPEDVLLAGLKVLREGREFRTQIDARRASISAGQAVELANDEALGDFLDAIDSEIDAESRRSPAPKS